MVLSRIRDTQLVAFWVWHHGYVGALVVHALKSPLQKLSVSNLCWFHLCTSKSKKSKFNLPTLLKDLFILVFIFCIFRTNHVSKIWTSEDPVSKLQVFPGGSWTARCPSEATPWLESNNDSPVSSGDFSEVKVSHHYGARYLELQQFTVHFTYASCMTYMSVS